MCREDYQDSSDFMMTIFTKIRPCKFFPEDLDCCRIKMVGGKKYWLVGKSAEASSYGCTSHCTYMTEGFDYKFCFKPGQYESECHIEGGNPGNTGSPGK